MGKVIDKRMSELGGKRSLPLCCADEATGLEETVEAWKAEIMTLLTKLDQLVVESAIVAENSNESETLTIVTPVVEAEAVIVTPIISITKEIGIPVGLLDLSGVSECLQLTQQISLPPESSQLPNCKKVISNGPSIEIKSSSHQLDSQIMPSDGWNAKTPFEASIIG
jgi:sulfite reductase alpha subunit-like flavoprotein